ncbi:ECF RNA polymerase sigma factor SigK [Kitasatospora sp. NBC_01539]|uniref:ECF RNA polymerase sigma factor SigK n=1 Tax=Kitasatospora sp. NBC_01539 TaxID=2903577 RepID=UPI0038601000
MRLSGSGLGPDDLRHQMTLVALGDHDAFARLYDAVVARVLGLVRRVLRDPAQSEEVTQEVMLEVWRTAARYRPERGEVMPWVLTIAHRRAVDRVRAVHASADRDRRVAASSHTPVLDEVPEQAEGRLEREQVRRVLRQLPHRQRESLVLAYYGGYSQAQIADILGTPLGTVKTRIRDGMIRMRGIIATES